MLIKRGKVWHSRIMHEGQFHWKSLRTGNHDQAIKHEAIIRSELLRGEFGILDSKGTPSLEQFTSRLQAHWDANTAPRTAKFYKDNMQTLNNCGFLSLTKLNRIDQSLIEKFTRRRLDDGVAIVTVNRALGTLRRALHLAAEWKLIGRVPKVRMLPDENQRDYVISDETVDAMVTLAVEKFPTSRFHLMLPFLVDTGLRISEACDLKKEHVLYTDQIPTSIKILKGKSKYAKREIPLTVRATLVLNSAIKESKSEYCWAGRYHKGKLTRGFVSGQFRTVREELGIGPECVLHSTRHTFCTRLGNAGADAFTIQKLAGHSSILISQRYVHTDMAAKETAIRLLDR
jgi:site-specific recombinase XerD